MPADFPTSEFEARAAAAQRAMRAAGFGALWFTTEPELRYFSGFRTPFWQSPTRPWHLILPASGKPIAVIPEIGAALMASTWVEDIRTWPAPQPADDGVSLLRAALAGRGTIGMPMGAEASLRLPLTLFREATEGLTLADCTPLIRDLQMVKSPAEVALIETACAAAGRAFARAPSLFHVGQPHDAAFRAFRIALLEEGAEETPYLVGGAGPDGYGDVISPPGPTPLAAGDILMFDTGATYRGYFCDFDRNFALGAPGDAARRAYDRLFQATEAGLAAARPGARAVDLFHAMAAHLGAGSAVGRLGHGLGMRLTEWPSLAQSDETELRPGMVLTLEPSTEVAPGRVMVEEENILITEDAPRLLTPRAPSELPQI